MDTSLYTSLFVLFTGLCDLTCFSKKLQWHKVSDSSIQVNSGPHAEMATGWENKNVENQFLSFSIFLLSYITIWFPFLKLYLMIRL